MGFHQDTTQHSLLNPDAPYKPCLAHTNGSSLRYELPLGSEQESDSWMEETPLATTEMEITPKGFLFSTEGSKACLEMIKRLANALDIKLSMETPLVMDVVHQLVLADFPRATLFPMLPAHAEGLKDTWKHPHLFIQCPEDITTCIKSSKQQQNFCLFIQSPTQ